ALRPREQRDRAGAERRLQLREPTLPHGRGSVELVSGGSGVFAAVIFRAAHPNTTRIQCTPLAASCSLTQMPSSSPLPGSPTPKGRAERGYLLWAGARRGAEL